ncbi:MCE family protein [Actinoallomurus bryophytorum]|uniref:Phospholipid/cholesterol/gamma-HCH transport system substrate-binding protein n=1 Tax=Actinoallomurus bryophytorum TaxID=1490222 RepID=A0A543CLU9_9ACTN|nr:MCE family protein [Actinoallomurus bryophytorum]TQL98069.1 phospholipid/cholesterol/gamma-HCH transport system substrate-binding protein [Actinoallomurus bryophytorum]
MSSTVSGGSWSERLRYRLYGLAFVIVVVLLVLLMLAQYNKAFTPVYRVTVNADRAGLQLVPHSDVKVRGLIVGEVKGIRSTPTGAAIDLALDPGKAALVPDNSSARMLPKTVFGEKYVDLVPPATNPGPHLKSGDVIAQDKSTTAVEVTQLLDDIMPLLTAVKPEKLNATLNALATALQGRGEEIGQTIDLADSYLTKLNPHLPTIIHDLRQLSTVSDNLNAAAPDLFTIMQNLQVSSRTIVDKEPQLVSILDKGINLTGKLTPFAEDNEPRLVGAQLANRKALALVAKYSPSIPCVFQGMAKLQPRLVKAVGGGQPGVHVTIELSKPRPAFKPGLDTPSFKDQRNPRCYGLPNPKVPFPQYQTLDGTEDDKWWSGGAGRSLSDVLIKPGTSTDDDAMLKSLMGPAMGTPANQVSDIASLLYAPAASGMMVTVK